MQPRVPQFVAYDDPLQNIRQVRIVCDRMDPTVAQIESLDGVLLPAERLRQQNDPHLPAEQERVCFPVPVPDPGDLFYDFSAGHTVSLLPERKCSSFFPLILFRFLSKETDRVFSFPVLPAES